MQVTTSIKTILLIDDDQDDCYLFTDAIKKSFPSISVAQANNFIEGIAYLTSATPDIIFLDLNMPFKNGLDALSELKSDESFRNIPVVIFSSSNYTRDVKTGYERGAALYFTKPSSFESLLLALQQILSKDWGKPAAITAQYFINGAYEAFSAEIA
jgi:CheY-like chemotaxis protein